MATLSLCMIVRNEEATLPRCLDSVAGLFDEIIIVDTGSTDATKALSLRYTDKVFDFAWIDDFAAARNFAFSKATMGYIMWLDADDVVFEPDKTDILQIKETLTPDVFAVMLKYNVAFDEQSAPTFSFYRERIVKNLHKDLWRGRVHEVMEIPGHRIYHPAAISHKKEQVHDPARNLRIYERILESGEALSARDQFYYARELYYHQRYSDAALMFSAFLDEGKGWLENNIEACRMRGLCLEALGEGDRALESYLQSFFYDRPRAEIACEIGRLFMEREHFQNAVFWYTLALNTPMNTESGAFVLADCYGYLPCIQLCVAHFNLGDATLARQYNKKAGEFRPFDEAVMHNEQFFAAYEA